LNGPIYIANSIHVYEPTPKGQRLLHELDLTLPRLDRLLSGTDFDPAVEEASFRIAATDHASHVLCLPLRRTVLPRASKVTFKFVPPHDAQFEAAEKGRIDLLLVADDGTAPAHFAKEVIFEVHFVCVVATESSLGRGLTLKQYLAAGHIGIDIVGGIQTIPEKKLAAIGAKRHCPMVVSYHTTAMRSVIGTNLVATVPRRIAQLGGFESFRADRQCSSCTRGILIPHGLAPTNERRRGARLVAFDYPQGRKNNIDRVKNANSATGNVS
jgi:DNA-binding transcriptional LysR family regulator